MKIRLETQERGSSAKDKFVVKRTLGILIALAILAALALPKIRLSINTASADAISKNGASKDGATKDGTSKDGADLASGTAKDKPRLRVAVQEMVPEPLTEQLSTTGTVRANEQVDLVGEISGKIAEILFREGSRVKTGQLLLKIDDSELQAEHERTTFRRELAERREAQKKKLRDEGVISGEEYDVALNELNVLRSELRLIEAQLLKTEIRAPFAGIIGLRYVSPGSYLSPQRLIASLQNVDSVKIDFSVPEKYASRMRPGGEITFHVKGDERAFTGTIYAVEPSVDPETRSLLLRARTPNADGSLLPGAFADVEIIVAETADALTVPAIAVIPELGGKKVYVVEEGQAQPRPVTTGIRTDERVQILTGLAPGDRVIVSAIQQLRPGLDVEATTDG